MKMPAKVKKLKRSPPYIISLYEIQIFFGPIMGFSKSNMAGWGPKFKDQPKIAFVPVTHHIRPYKKFTTTFIFDPIMGIFKFSDPRWRVKEVEFSKNLFTSMILIYSDSDFHL